MEGKGKALMALMQERKDLIQKMIDFEKKASDPKRLFQASFQLLEEEKWRNSCLPRLLKLDRDLIRAIQEFEKLAGKPVMFGEKRYLDTLVPFFFLANLFCFCFLIAILNGLVGRDCR